MHGFRFGKASLRASLTVLALAAALGGCTSSSNNSETPRPKPKPTPTVTATPTASPTATQSVTPTATLSPTPTPTSTPTPAITGGLWVPTLFGPPSVNEFDPARRAVSGNPDPQFVNESADLLLPAAQVFDGSRNMWVTNCSDLTFGAGTIAEFTAAQLANLGTDSAPPAHILLLDDGSFDNFHCPWGEQFDAAGNLWVANRMIPNLVSFTPAQLAAGGAQTPNTIITSSFFGSPRAIAFDASANLWVVENQNSEVLGFKAATLAAALGHSGPVNPDIVITSASFNDIRALAFDTGGNLWVADATTAKLFEIAAADLTTGSSKTPVVIIGATVVDTADGAAASLDTPDGLAFDPSDGDLWVSNLLSDNVGSLAKYTPSQLTTSGTPAPAVFLDSDIFGLNLHLPTLLTFGPIP
jgi:sugar lactone lactonase YvrE